MDENDRCFCEMSHIPLNLPAVSSRLRNVTPSKELLDHYRTKIEKFEKDFEEISSQIDDCKNKYEEEFHLRKTISQKEEEICQLQKAVSDMEIHLFRERDQVFRLNAENDRLNLKQLEDKKIIEHLLGLVAIPEREVTIFLPSNKTKKLQESTGMQGKCMNADETMLKIQNDIMKSQVNSLQNQLDEQNRISKTEISALIEDRRIRNEEFESSRKKNMKTINELTEKLRDVELKLAANLVDVLRNRKRSHVTFQDVQSPIRNVKTRLTDSKTTDLTQHKPVDYGKNNCQLSCKHLSIIKDLEKQLKHFHGQIKEKETEHAVPLTFPMEINPQLTRKRVLSKRNAGKMQNEDREADVEKSEFNFED